ncbi:MAG TPA: TetR/AcrR family transcriptional regulator C-terminal domain-containing protein [Trebonia sp.]|jgi:AcrR family transcriptional regulator|nr:TetR/AcrR family transcriptional regulator C-terminal domain-containing protein [Trebonia sp.]
MSENTSAGGSVWLRPDRPGRGPAPEHSRAEIATAAIALAGASGLAAVTMRSVAAAIGTGPSSLYRYVANRAELVELMADQARGELAADGTGPGEPAARLLTIAREGLVLYRRHPWLLDVPATPVPGPNAIAFIEHCLTALTGVDQPAAARLETIALFSGAVRLCAQAEVEQRRAGRGAAQWQGELAAYLTQVAGDGRHPHLAAALASAAGAPAAGAGDPFERAMAKILAGLLSAR